MAYYMNVGGMEELSETLEKLEERAPAVAAQALYDGAGIMADEIRRGAKSIKTAPFKYARAGQTRLPSPEEKEIVVAAGAGIAKFDKNGTEVDTSVGYRASGYATLKGRVKPIPLIINSINSGTSFMNKQPFVRKAKNKGSPKAIQAMKDKIEESFEAIINNK